jgi:hypothetical protein
MLQGLTSEHPKKIPEDSVVPGHTHRIRWVAMLDRLVVDGHGDVLLRLWINAGEEVIELHGSDRRHDLCAP